MFQKCDRLRLQGSRMNANGPMERVLRFGAFELDRHAGELRRRGVKLRLSGQPLQLLSILLLSPGRLVSRDEIRRQIWPTDTFVDFDHGLNNAICRIREILADLPQSPRFIETLPRRGYRFIGRVEETASFEPPRRQLSRNAVSKTACAQDKPSSRIPRSTGRRPPASRISGSAAFREPQH